MMATNEKSSLSFVITCSLKVALSVLLVAYVIYGFVNFDFEILFASVKLGVVDLWGACWPPIAMTSVFLFILGIFALSILTLDNDANQFKDITGVTLRSFVGSLYKVGSTIFVGCMFICYAVAITFDFSLSVIVEIMSTVDALLLLQAIFALELKVLSHVKEKVSALDPSLKVGVKGAWRLLDSRYIVVSNDQDERIYLYLNSEGNLVDSNPLLKSEEFKEILRRFRNKLKREYSSEGYSIFVASSIRLFVSNCLEEKNLKSIYSRFDVLVAIVTLPNGTIIKVTTRYRGESEFIERADVDNWKEDEQLDLQRYSEIDFEDFTS